MNGKAYKYKKLQVMHEVKNKLYHSHISPNEVLQCLVYKVYYLLAKNSKVDGRGGLKERGCLPLKREGILQRGKIEDLC